MGSRRRTTAGISSRPALTEENTVVVCDLKGYGESRSAPGGELGEGYSNRERAAELVELMGRLGHRALLGRRARSRRPGRLPDGAGSPGCGRAARRPQHRPDRGSIRAYGAGRRARVLALVLPRPAAALRRAGDRGELRVRRARHPGLLDRAARCASLPRLPTAMSRPSPRRRSPRSAPTTAPPSTSTGRWTARTAMRDAESPARCSSTGARRRARCPTRSRSGGAGPSRWRAVPLPSGHFIPEEAPEELVGSLTGFLKG